MSITSLELFSGFPLPYPSRVTVETPLPSPCTAFPSPSRSIRFGDVSEANGREIKAGNSPHFRMDHVTRNALAAMKNEA